MIVTGFTLAILTGSGFYLLYRKLNPSIRKFMQKHVLFTDAIACALTYMLFGGTLVALFAAAWMGLLVSSLLAVTSNPRLNAIVERYLTKMSDMMRNATEWLASKIPEETALNDNTKINAKEEG